MNRMQNYRFNNFSNKIVFWSKKNYAQVTLNKGAI